LERTKLKGSKISIISFSALKKEDMPFVSSVEGTYSFGRANKTATVAFNYTNFSSTAGLTQVSTAGVINNALYLTTAVNADTGNVYRSTAIPYNRNFTFEWNFDCSGGTTPPADGFCLQWSTTNTANGLGGGGVGRLSISPPSPVPPAVQALTFLTYTNNIFQWYKNDVDISGQSYSDQNFQRNLYYWADYNHSASTMKIYVSITPTKPVSVNFSLTGFSFDATSYYIGFGAATGGANANHILRSMKLTFT
jgi:hypothetical protein